MGIIIGLIIVVAVIFIALSIAAVILRAACHFARTNIPGFGLAIGIVLVTGIVQAIIGTIINVAFGVPMMQDPNTPPDPNALAASIIGFLVNTPITMLLYQVMIPTEGFGKAALVWLLQLVIVICILIIIVALVVVFSLLLGGF